MGIGPIRGIADIEAIEAVPLDSRIDSWDINEWLRRGAALDPEKPALICLDEASLEVPPVVVSYAALHRQATRYANLFHSLGVGSGDSVFFLLPTVPEFYPVMLAALARGVACGINWMLESRHLLELIRAADAKLIVALGPTPGYDIWEKLEAIRAELPRGVRLLSVKGPGGTPLPASDLDGLAVAQPDDRRLFTATPKPDDLAALLHSGGTTGSPKLVKLTHRGFVYKCWANTVLMDHDSHDVIFADYPMFHIAGFLGRGLLPLVNGMSIVIPTPLGARSKSFIAHYWKLIERFGVTVFSGVPTTLSVLVKNPPQGVDLRSLRTYATTGSTALPVSVAEEIERLIGVRMLLTYGATEYTQNVTQGPRDAPPRYGSAGIRAPYTRLRIAELGRDGAVTRDCAPDEIGTVLIASPGNTPGYVDPTYNAGFFTPDGWINSGDLGRIDADGYLWLTGRAKDVIIRGGHNIDPAIIEEALLAHEAVHLAAAVAKPDAYAGELPVAYVQLVPGGTVTAETLKAFVRERIAERAANPADIHILDELPLTDVRKPAKQLLRQDAARRVFESLLQPLLDEGARLTLTVGPNEAGQMTVAIALSPAAHAARDEIERRVRAVMQSHTIAYGLSWA